MADLKNTTIGTTNAVELPDQNLSSATGTAKLRFNTTGGLNTLEFYDGGTWRPVTGYAQGIIGTGGQTINYTDHGIVHIFTTTGSHTFTPAFTGNVQVMVVGGGGAGGYDWSGGGGAGGVIINRSFPVSAGSGYNVTVGAEGRGGNGGGGSPTIAGQNGGNSVFSTSARIKKPSKSITCGNRSPVFFKRPLDELSTQISATREASLTAETSS